MSATMIAVLAVQGVLFLGWTVAMFTTLFQLRARISRRYGPSLFSLPNTLRGLRDFLRDPDWKARRRLLLILTLALFAVILLQVATFGQITG